MCEISDASCFSGPKARGVEFASWIAPCIIEAQERVIRELVGARCHDRGPNTRPCPSEVSGERLWPELPEGEISFAVCGDRKSNRKCNSFLVNKYWIRHLFVTSFSYGPRRIFIALPPSILSLCCWSPSSDSLLP